jgi:hypothetical protein
MGMLDRLETVEDVGALATLLMGDPGRSAR